MENFASLFETHTSQIEMREGEVINAEVVAIDNKYVTVHAGLKSESIISINEFKNDNGELEVTIGDIVLVAIETIEDGYGETRLSREKARKIAAWNELEQALTNSSILSGSVYGRIKGGLGILYKNIKLFLPGSLLDIRTVRDFAPYENKDIEFKVIKIDRRRNNIVISRKAVLLERNEDSGKLLENVEEGSIVTGIIKNITDYGAFVDLGNIDGLLYITDLSWKRVKHPSELLTVGQEVRAKVLKFDKEKHRVSLGLKQLLNDPWLDIVSRYPVSTRLYGKISNIADYGAFVTIENGVEGLVHISEMDWTNKNINPNKILKIDDEVQVQILEIDANKRRISLGLKQCQQNPWTSYAKQHKKGDKIAGTIRSITDFGLFVGLEGGIDGLVHVSDISWNTAGDVAIKNYKKGQEIQAIITAIDIDKERIALSIKQLDEDIFSRFLNNFEKDSAIQSTIKSVTNEEIIVTLSDDIDGIILAKDADIDKNIDLTSKFKIDDKISALIINIDKKNKLISLSMKALKLQNKQNEAEQQQSEIKASGTTNLGDLLQNTLQK